MGIRKSDEYSKIQSNMYSKNLIYISKIQWVFENLIVIRKNPICIRKFNSYSKNLQVFENRMVFNNTIENDWLNSEKVTQKIW